MDRLTEVLRGLEIFKSMGATEIGAEHDEIYVLTTDCHICPNTKAKLEELHWFYDDDVDGWKIFV